MQQGIWSVCGYLHLLETLWMFINYVALIKASSFWLLLNIDSFTLVYVMTIPYEEKSPKLSGNEKNEKDQS